MWKLLDLLSDMLMVLLMALFVVMLFALFAAIWFGAEHVACDLFRLCG